MPVIILYSFMTYATFQHLIKSFKSRDEYTARFLIKQSFASVSNVVSQR